MQKFPHIYDQIRDTTDKRFAVIVDEAHNFGSNNLRKRLYSQIEYRLALSATLERHGDEEGTEALKSILAGSALNMI